MYRLRRTLSWLILVALLLQIISPLAPAPAYAAGASQSSNFGVGNFGIGALQIAQTDAPQPVQALLIYNHDTAAAQSARALLEANGVAVVLRQLGDETVAPPQPNLFVPSVNRGEGGSAQAANPRLAQDDDLSDFDVILLSDDLDEGGVSALDPALQQAILDSERPVMGLGRGGARFLLDAGLLDATDVGSKPQVAAVNLCDRGAGVPLFQGETDLPLDQDTYGLYAQGQPTVFAALVERRPQTRRLACADESAGEVAILLLQGRFALWGFAGAPDSMTETGQALFTNLVWLLAGDGVEIPLATGALRPTPGVEQDLLDELATGAPQYALLQLYRLPTAEEHAQLAQLGIELLTYLAHSIYSAKIRPDADFDHPLVQDLLRFAGIYRPEYKLDPALQQAPLPEDIAAAMVFFFPDVSPEAIATLLASLFDAGYSQGAIPTDWIVPPEIDKLLELAESMLVRYIAPVPVPVDESDTVRPLVFTDNVQNAAIAGSSISYLGGSGSGITLGIFERRPDAGHNDLSPRVSSGANAHANQSEHATHVAGIVLSSGGMSAGMGLTEFQRRGHAPGATLVSQSYSFIAGPPVFSDNIGDSVLNHGVFAHNHSYGGASPAYGAVEAAIDLILRGDGETGGGAPILPSFAVWSAGNNGVNGGLRGFYSITKSFKNAILVGSLDTIPFQLSNFSSRGPAYDGRIKPEVVAPGCRNSAPNPSTGIESTLPGNAYGGLGWCGTSMAAPVVTGIAGLLLEQYRNTFGAAFRPLPSSLKAILVNSAVDQQGTSFFNDPDCNCMFNYGVGPDWATGYGMVNAQAAVAAVRARNIIEGVVSPANLVDTYTIQVTVGRPELRFTLAWDDEPGDTSTGATVRSLVNDLDLVLVDPNGDPHFPWVLDPLPVTNNPGVNGIDPITQADINNNPAFRDVNDRDNVEQVVVDNPMPGAWQIQVTASALPNANPQPYSLAGDFRELSIIRPNTSNVADAGDPVTPNVILVRLEARQPFASPTTSAFVDVTAADFQVEIEGIAADVINGLAVGDQFWLNVRPAAGQYNAGSKYDLSVTWTGYGADSKTRAVLFTEREVTDRAIVVDYSGSMIGYDKMQAAQNASRLFIDQSLPDDRVSVVGFSTGVITPYAIQEVSNDPLTPELNAAKNAVDSLIPDDLTAIGLGMIEGYNQVATPRANPAEEALVDVIILLSDGMQNVNPYYDTPAVKGLIQPTDTIVHTVGVGPANAGFFSLLEDIAEDNDGLFFSVTETTPGGGGAAIAAADAASSMGLDAQPVQLPNRLAEAYKNIAEDLLRENRIFQARGEYMPALTHVPPNPVWRFPVPDNTARLNVALNWSNEHAHMRMILTAPDETVYEFDPKNSKDATCRSDKTHEVCIIDNPVPGIWRVDGILPLGFNEDFEYFLWASAQTPVKFHLHIGTAPEQRLPGEPIHLIGFVHQNGKPLPGPETSVVVKVFDPWGNDLLGEVKLLDDGKSNDGQAGDGIFGGTFIASKDPGPYQVRAVAKGNNAEGQQFELLANASFQLRPRVLYVHQDDLDVAQQYQAWIQTHGIPVDLAHKHALPTPQKIQAEYSLVIIGPDTAEWTDVQVRPVIASEVKVLGLGKGGHSFLRFLQIPAGESAEGHSIAVGDYGDDIWYSDYEFGIGNLKLLQLYADNTTRIDIPERSQGISAIFGTRPENTTLATLLMFNSYWTLWGFQDGPKAMTDTGRELFINTVLRAMR